MNKTQERDQKLQGLSLVVIRKRNDIKRRKDAIALQKLNDLMTEDDDYCSKKRDFIEKIDGFRKRKSTFDVNDPMRYDLEDEARHNEHMLSLLRNEHERNIHRINNRHMIARTALDDEDRQLSEWEEEEKGAIMREHLERKEEADADNAQHEAE